MGPANSHRISRVPRYSGAPSSKVKYAGYAAFMLFGHTFQYVLLYRTLKLYSKSYYPDFAETKPVWANPRSLATTEGITFVFFSYG